MEFPSGHHSYSHHHHRRTDDQQDTPYYPPPDTAPPNPSFFQNEFAPPPPHPPPHPPSYFQDSEFPPPPPPSVPHFLPHNEYAPPPPPPIHQTPVYLPPPPAQVTHFSHDHTETQSETHHHSFHPHMPSFIHHITHHSSDSPGLDLSNKPTFKVYSKADPNFHLTIRDGKVVLAPSNPSDEFQNWYKDEKYSTRVKDEEGYPCFSLVNKATGQAVKHSIGATHPVQLITYNPDALDESVLWTESKDLGDGYRAVRMVNNVRLNLDAFHGDEKSGGVHDGTTIVLWQWNKGNNQRWRITPH